MKLWSVEASLTVRIECVLQQGLEASNTEPDCVQKLRSLHVFHIFTVERISMLVKVNMNVCHSVVMLLTHFIFGKSLYGWKREIQLVIVFFFQPASNSIVSIDPVQDRRDVIFRRVVDNGFCFAISADVREEEVTIPE